MSKMNPIAEAERHVTRRQFFGRGASGLGGLALGSLLSRDLAAEDVLRQVQHFAPRAKRVIYLFQSGAPSQLDLFDYKPGLVSHFDEELPDSIRQGQRLTGMTSGQARFPTAPSVFDFKQHGNSGAWVSNVMPHIASVADKLCFVKSMYTEAINHDPAITFFQTGSQIAGRPSVGAWLSYGLGKSNENLPAFVAMTSSGSGRTVNSQGALTKTNYGRDHHPRCFTIFMAGGGIKSVMSYGATDDYSYNITEKPVHVHDLHATMLHLLGIDHEALT